MPNHRKPTKMHKMQGTYREDRHGGKEPDPKPLKVAPEPPEHFNEYAKEEWYRVVPNLIQLGLVSEYDLGILEIGIEHYGIYRELWENIYTEVYLDKAGRRRKRKRTLQQFLENKSVQNIPEVSMMKNSLQIYKDIIFRFGITPVERSKVKLDEKEEVSDMEKFLKKNENTA